MIGRALFDNAERSLRIASLGDQVIVAVDLPIEMRDIHELDRAECPKEVSPERMTTFLGGRTALRHAALALSVPLLTIPKNARGAPSVPPEVAASIAHKRGIAVALAGPNAGWNLGVDVEEIREPRAAIENRVLRDDERARWRELGAVARNEYLLASFSIKEAVYKAIDPIVQRWVDYHECEVRFSANGRVRAITHLAEQKFDCEVQLFRQEFQRTPYFISVARARPR
jgi:enterobactin synthetase component D